MLWVAFALGAALAWGMYGPSLHKGQVALGNPMRALLCVGVAYFLVGVLVPVSVFLFGCSVGHPLASSAAVCGATGSGWP